MAVIGVVGFGIGSIWWASSIQTKIDILLEESRSNNSANKLLIEQVNRHETRLGIIEASRPKQ